MRWGVAVGAVLVAWMTVQTLVVARRSSLESDELSNVAVTVVSLALVLTVAGLGAVIGLRWLGRRRLTMPSPPSMAIVALAAGLLVGPISVAPLPPHGTRVPAAGQSCDALAPLPAAVWARAAEQDPRLAYSDGCIFDL